MSENEATFEQTYAQLQEIVARLEEGGLSLEESLELFERGMALSQRCQQTLEEAELRIQKLVAGPDGDVELVDFES